MEICSKLWAPRQVDCRKSCQLSTTTVASLSHKNKSKEPKNTGHKEASKDFLMHTIVIKLTRIKGGDRKRPQLVFKIRTSVDLDGLLGLDGKNFFSYAVVSYSFIANLYIG